MLYICLTARVVIKNTEDSQPVRLRISHHRSDRNKLDVLLKKYQDNIDERDHFCHDAELERIKNETAVVKHAIDTNHAFDYNEYKVLTKEQNYDKLKVLEMLYIKQHNTVNIRTGTEGLSIIYNGLFRKN